MTDPSSTPPVAWTPGPPPPAGRDRRSAAIGIAIVALMVVVALLAVLSATPSERRPVVDPTRLGARPEGADLVVAIGDPTSWDPARIGDATSAAVLAQVWEGLTTLDPEAQVRPALAHSWSVEDGGRRIVFQLREGITFSDGTPIRGQDVVDSWLRALDPGDPSPLAWLLGDIVGAREVLAGTGDRADVAIRADGGTVTVDFRRPAAYFPAAAASPTLAVVPPTLGDRADGPRLPDGGLAVSGAYVPVTQDEAGITLVANEAY